MALTLRRRAGYPPAFVNLRVAPASVRLRDLVPLLSVLVGRSPVEGESGSKASVLRGSGAGMRPDPRRGNGVDEADLSAESDPSQASTWVPRADEYTCGADDPEAEAREGSKAPRGGEALEVEGEGRQRALWTSRSAPVSTGLPARVGDRSESRVSVLRRARKSGKSGRRRGFPVPTGTDGESESRWCGGAKSDQATGEGMVPVGRQTDHRGGRHRGDRAAWGGDALGSRGEGGATSTVAVCVGATVKAVRAFVLGMIRVYQVAIGPALGPACRFEPSCSRFAAGAVERHGLIRGGWLAVGRLGRCRPGGGSGYDPVP